MLSGLVLSIYFLSLLPAIFLGTAGFFGGTFNFAYALVFKEFKKCRDDQYEEMIDLLTNETIASSFRGLYSKAIDETVKNIAQEELFEIERNLDNIENNRKTNNEKIRILNDLHAKILTSVASLKEIE